MTPLELAAYYKKQMQCNCDLDNWEPDPRTGHSPVCRIHKAAMRGEPLKWRCHLPNLFDEIINGHPSPGPLIGSVNITKQILVELAERAAEIDDPQLNILMLRLSMYDVPPKKITDAINKQMNRS